MEGGGEEVRAEGAGSVQLRFQRVAPPQQFRHPRHDPLLFGQRGNGYKHPVQFLLVDLGHGDTGIVSHCHAQELLGQNEAKQIVRVYVAVERIHIRAAKPLEINDDNL